MTDLFAWVVFTAILTYWLTPRVFLFADRRVGQQRLRSLSPSASAEEKADFQWPDSLQWPEVCDALARFTRSGVPARDALIAVFSEMQEPQEISSRINQLPTLRHFFNSMSPQRDANDDYAISLISHSLIESNFVPQALDHAGRTLRDIRQCEQEARVAASQARLSARLLTAFPIVVLTLGFLVSPAVRHGLSTPAVILCLVIGALINRAGWRWINFLLERSLVKGQLHHIFEIADNLCVAMFAGMSARISLLHLPQTSDISRQINSNLQEGVTFVDALSPMTTHPSPFAKGLAALLITAESDGLPILQSVQQLANEARLERRRDIDTRVRQLPTKLTLPLVLCILPSFLLCTMAPLATVVLSQVTLPSAAS